MRSVGDAGDSAATFADFNVVDAFIVLLVEFIVSGRHSHLKRLHAELACREHEREFLCLAIRRSVAFSARDRLALLVNFHARRCALIPLVLHIYLYRKLIAEVGHGVVLNPSYPTIAHHGGVAGPDGPDRSVWPCYAVIRCSATIDQAVRDQHNPCDVAVFYPRAQRLDRCIEIGLGTIPVPSFVVGYGPQ